MKNGSNLEQKNDGTTTANQKETAPGVLLLFLGLAFPSSSSSKYVGPSSSGLCYCSHGHSSATHFETLRCR